MDDTTELMCTQLELVLREPSAEMIAPRNAGVIGRKIMKEYKVEALIYYTKITFDK